MSSQADESLQRLLDGNRRYVANTPSNANKGSRRRAEIAQAQQPFAIVLGCADSRVPPEIIFDCGLGDLFVMRTAGQVVDQAVLGSIEYGVLELGVPLLMVLGHERCGAVKATIEQTEKDEAAPGQIDMLVNSIRPAVEKVKHLPGNLLENAVKANIAGGVELLKTSPLLAKAVAGGYLTIAGGCYDLDSGKVILITS